MAQKVTHQKTAKMIKHAAACTLLHWQVANIAHLTFTVRSLWISKDSPCLQFCQQTILYINLLH